MSGFRKMNPAPKIALTRFGAGVHSFWKAEKDLPVGIAPSVLRTWHDAGVRRLFRIAVKCAEAQSLLPLFKGPLNLNIVLACRHGRHTVQHVVRPGYSMATVHARVLHLPDESQEPRTDLTRFWASMLLRELGASGCTAAGFPSSLTQSESLNGS